MKTFGEYLRELRTKSEKGITQEMLAKAIGRSKMLISSFENGKNSPPQDELLDKIIDFLKLSAEEANNLRLLASKERNEIPKDISDYFYYHPTVYKALQIAEELNTDETFWEELIHNLEDSYNEENS